VHAFLRFHKAGRFFGVGGQRRRQTFTEQTKELTVEIRIICDRSHDRGVLDDA
jgi:hypothetical protein